MRPCNAAKAARHSRLHSKTRKFGDDGLHLAGRNELVLQADDIKADAGRAHRNLGFLVEADRGRRIEGDTVPDQLSAALIEPTVSREGPREISPFHFETPRTGKALVERDVMQQGSDGDDFRVVLDALELSDPRREQPGTDDVIEQVGLALSPGILHRPVNDCSCGNAYPR